MTMPDIHVLKSYGKINWFLGVGDLREDGYHEIRSLMQKIALYDEIEIAIASFDSITCNYLVPVDGESLLGRTLVALRRLCPALSEIRFTINIKKSIPPGSGLGGGSSNVATLLRFLPPLLGIHVAEGELLKVALSLGSDVPFFLYNTPFALVRGRGEEVIPLHHRPRRFLVLLFPSFPVSTSWAYRKWDEEVGNLKHGAFQREWTLERFLQDGKDEMIEQVIWNDFEGLVFRYYPVLRMYQEMLLELGCQKAFMTGSGSTLVGTVESAEKGKEIVEKLGQKGIKATLTSTLVE